MLIKIALVLEIISVLICIYCINGKKIKLDIEVRTLFLGLLVILDYYNSFQMSGPSQIIVYVLIYIFCKVKFKISYRKAVISIILFVIILSALEFICLLLTNILWPDQEGIRTVIGNILVLFICVFVLPKCKLDRLQDAIFRQWRYIKVLVVFMALVIATLLLQDSIFSGVYAEVFIFAIPAIIMLLVMLINWSNTQITVENMQKELVVNKSMQEKYDALLVKLRMRQHEFKNHIAAIFSAHYTYDTYEKLVKAQEEYCSKLQQENKYNNLLLIGNNIFAGFLYGKFQDAEDDGIEIEYSIKTNLEALGIPEYYLIEIIGIILDNAVETAREKDCYKKIYFAVIEEEVKYRFVVRNRNIYVPYAEMETWFLFEHSLKGPGRGIGLFHAKNLCDELKCNIGCGNIIINEENWIEFILEVDKADR